MESHINELKGHLDAITTKLKDELRAVRSNRPSVGLIEEIPVECYGQRLTVREVGSLAIRPPRTIEVTIWDKAAVPAVMKGIEEAKIGLSVSNDGNTVRASLPALTDERREEFSKLVKKMSEEARIQVRSRRDDAMKKAKTAQDAKQLSEDQVFTLKEKLQKTVDEANKRIEGLLDEKLAELAE
jgi:ribosome recycling factor